MLAPSPRKVPESIKERKKTRRDRRIGRHNAHTDSDAQILLAMDRASAFGDFKFYHLHVGFSRRPEGSRIGLILSAKDLHSEVDTILNIFNSEQFSSLYKIRDNKEIAIQLTPMQWAILKEARGVKLKDESINEALESKRFFRAKFLPHHKLGAIRKDGIIVQQRVAQLIDGEFIDLHSKKLLKALVNKIVETYDGITFEGARHMRKNGEPAYTHPLETFELAVKVGMKNVVILAALLGHDLLEDIKELPCNAKPGEKNWHSLSYEGVDKLYRSCGFTSKKDIDQIWLLISALTKPEKTHKGRTLSASDSQNRAFDQLRSIESLFIKVCDCSHNMITQDVFLKKPKKVEEHINEAETLRDLFKGHLAAYGYELHSKPRRGGSVHPFSKQLYTISLTLLDVFEQQIERTKGLLNSESTNSDSFATT